MMAVDLQEQIKLIPDKPGVYQMKALNGDIIYVGKALSLKNRVRSYFQASKNLTPKTRIMVGHVYSIDTIVTDTEIEALILESNLIKKYRPKYNISLKDDKHFPFIRITMEESYPRILKARAAKKDGSRYFGPFTDAGALAETMELLRGIFPIRDCKKDIDRDPPNRPCLNYHIGRCQAPCQGLISRLDYHDIIQQCILFLEGRQDDLLKNLKQQMKAAAKELNYEKAAQIRNRIRSVEKIVARQKISASITDDRDIIAFSRRNRDCCVQVFFVRDGKLMGREQFFADNTEELSDEDVLTAVVKQYYLNAPHIPKEVVVPILFDDRALVEKWLTQRRGKKVDVIVPKRGRKKDLLDMVFKNTELALDQLTERERRKQDMTIGALKELADVLGLTDIPHRIECYDISNIQGREAVGSMVVFLDGVPATSDYRRFGIRTIEGPDDFAMMKEVLQRRFKHVEDHRLLTDSLDSSFNSLPDLVMVDGGKGQLGVAMAVLAQANLEGIPAIGLAKENEAIFTPYDRYPIILPRRSEALRLLQRIRDEAHRFAITFHRNLRTQRMVASVLDQIKGLGKQRKKTLLNYFGSVAEIAQADPATLADVLNINIEKATDILSQIRSRVNQDDEV
jgi:excinuclease ABC subunit C